MQPRPPQAAGHPTKSYARLSGRPCVHQVVQTRQHLARWTFYRLKDGPRMRPDE